jgi:hypothetical protein
MPRRARILTWNGKDVPAQLRHPPEGRYVVEAVEDEAPALTPDEEAGIEPRSKCLIVSQARKETGRAAWLVSTHDASPEAESDTVGQAACLRHSAQLFGFCKATAPLSKPTTGEFVGLQSVVRVSQPVI